MRIETATCAGCSCAKAFWLRAFWLKVCLLQGLLAAPRIVRGRPSQLKGAARRCAIAGATLDLRASAAPEGKLCGQAQGPALPGARRRQEAGVTGIPWSSHTGSEAVDHQAVPGFGDQGEKVAS